MLFSAVQQYRAQYMSTDDVL